jgi:uncharacterized repeat protein (TIGR03803 family)
VFGTNVSFTVRAISGLPLFYQWQWNGTNLVDGGQISGSTSHTLTILGVSTANEGDYSVTISNAYTSVTSSIASLTVITDISITDQPTNQKGVVPGTNAYFTVGAIGGLPLFYQWQRNGTNLVDDGQVVGSTGNNLSILNVSTANVGNYSVIVSNAFSTVISSTALLTVLPNPLPWVTLTRLSSFAGGDCGAHPNGLMLAASGHFYATTQNAAADYSGTLFRTDTNGQPVILYTFNNGADGSHPIGALVQDAAGNFYGTTVSGGTNLFADGTVFKATTNGIVTGLHSFAGGYDGSFPNAGLARGDDGNFYGTTYTGGTNDDNGTVFMLNPAGTLTILYEFTGGSDGSGPLTALTRGENGNFYGTTEGGGTNGGSGTVFVINTNGSFASLHSFGGDDGATPDAELTPSGNGGFYGVTAAGGTNGGYGTIYRITTDGKFTSVFSFDGGDAGANPSGGLIRSAGGTFYGTTANGGPLGAGTIFKFSPASGLTMLSWFGGLNGAQPESAPVFGPDGNLYGTTYAGGASGNGVIYRLTLPPLVTPVLQCAVTTNAALTLTWNAVPWQSYQVQANADLTTKNWVNLNPSVTTTNATATVLDTLNPAAQNYYRVLVLP